MRLVVLACGLLFTLAACGESNQSEGEREASAMTANAISSNDITAIDAVTGEAANMAADVEIDANLLEDANASGNQAGRSDRPRRPARPNVPAAGSPAPADDSATGETAPANAQ